MAGVDSAPSENEYQEYLLGVKVAGAWDWPHHLYVPNVMVIWEPKPPGSLWATPDLLRGSFFYYKKVNLDFFICLYGGDLHTYFLFRNYK